MAARLALLAAIALVAAACGSETEPRTFPPAAEPARSPVPDERPAGRVVDVGNKPEGVVADTASGSVAVALTDPNELAILRHDEGRVVRRVSLPGAPRHLRLVPGGGAVLVPAESADRLVEVPLPRGRPTVTPTGDGPHDADAAANRRRYVGDEFGSTLTVIEDGRKVTQVPTPLQPGGVAAIPDGPIAVVAVRERVVALYDPETNEKIAQAPAGVGPTHVEAGADGRVYVTDTGGNAILLFHSTPELRLLRRAKVAGRPYATTLDRTRGKLWVTQTALNRVTYLPADNRMKPSERSWATVRQPNAVAVDETTGMVYVASGSDGTLQAFRGYPPPER
jgi:DNA-binding beta-propeller fold protein YncE